MKTVTAVKKTKTAVKKTNTAVMKNLFIWKDNY